MAHEALLACGWLGAGSKEARDKFRHHGCIIFTPTVPQAEAFVLYRLGRSLTKAFSLNIRCNCRHRASALCECQESSTSVTISVRGEMLRGRCFPDQRRVCNRSLAASQSLRRHVASWRLLLDCNSRVSRNARLESHELRAPIDSKPLNRQ